MNDTQSITNTLMATSTTTMELTPKELSTTTVSTRNPYSNVTEQSTIQSTTPQTTTADRPTFIGAVVAGAVGVVVVVIVIAAVIVWRRKNGRCSLKKEGKQLNEHPTVYTLPNTKQKPIPSPRPDVTKTVHVTVSNLSTSNLYEDVDGQNTQSELTYTNESNYYLELIGPDEPEYAQTNKLKASGKVTDNLGDSDTYQNVDKDDKNTTKPDYYNFEVVNKAKLSTSI